MHISASFHAEKLFEQNDVTTEAARDMLKKFSTPQSADIAGLDIDPDDLGQDANLGLSATTPESLPEAIEGAQQNADLDLSATTPESPEATEGAQQSRINHDIIGQLHVIDTPRDGSCMLWSVLTGLSQEDKMSIRDSTDVISDTNVLRARDVTIPKLRQVISLELFQEAVFLRICSLQEATPSQDPAQKAKLEQIAKLEQRAKDIESSVGFSSIFLEPKDMKYIAKHIGKDIAIVTIHLNQHAYYLCTKEGDCIQSQSENFPKERFESALQNGPAIFAKDGHARCLRYINTDTNTGQEASNPTTT
jgi:hypothetical protein